MNEIFQKSNMTRWTAAVLLIFSAWLTIGSVVGGIGDFGANRIDFKQIYDAAVRLNHGQHLYPRRSQPMYPPDLYVYPPTPAILARPLAHCPEVVARKLWCAANVFFVFSGLGICVAAFWKSGSEATSIAIMLLSIARFWPLQTNFVLGQVNLLLFLLIAAMYWAIGRNRLLLFAVLVSCCFLIKTWMLGFMLFLVVKRAWRPLGVGVAIAIAGLSLGFAAVGWHEWTYFVETSRTYAIQPTLRSHSIRGVATMYLTKNPLITPLVNEPLAFTLFVLIGSLIVVVGLFLMFGRNRVRSTVADQLALSLVILSVLLLSPLFQLEYFIFCLPGLWLVLLWLPEAQWKVGFVLGAAIAYALWTRNFGGGFSMFPPEFSSGPRSLLLATGFCGTVVLWITTFAAIMDPSSDDHDKTPQAST